MKQVPFCRPAWLSLLTLSLVFTFLMEAELQAQPRYYDNWFFGDSAGLNFSTRTPRPLRGAISRQDSLLTIEGTASISDPCTGQLLFYTDGSTVWNRQHEVMKNGTGLKSCFSSTQAALIVPTPGDPHHYYIFTADCGSYVDPPNDGINYSIVDITGDNGLGEVTMKNILLLETATEKLAGIRHGNGTDFWVVAYQEETFNYHAWLVSSDGISDPVITFMLSPLSRDGSTIGYLKASPNGQWLFAVQTGTGKGLLMEFDNLTGRITRPIARLPSYYGASFSPNSEYLFVAPFTGTGLERTDHFLRYTVSSGDSATIVASVKLIGKFPLSTGMQLAPDGNIYIALPPNRVGLFLGPNYNSVVFRDSGIVFPTRPQTPEKGFVTAGLPNCIDGFLLPDTAFERERQSSYDTTICPGTPVRLHASKGIGYQWEPSPDLNCLDCRTPFAFPTTSTSYFVTIQTPFGCDLYDTVNVIVHDLPPVDAGPDQMICGSGSIRLRASGGVNYWWDDSPDLSCIDCANPVATPTQTTTYFVTVWDAEGCQARDSVTITVHPYPDIAAGNDTTVCSGTEVRLSATGGTDYRWEESPDLSCTDCADPVVAPTETTTYSVTGFSVAGCAKRDSVTVFVSPLPELAVGDDRKLCRGDSIRLYAEGSTRYLWEPSEGLSAADISSPLAFPATTTTYRVTTWNTQGCAAVDSLTVFVRDPQVVPLRIDRRYRTYSGTPLIIPVELSDSLSSSDITELDFELGYDPDIMIPDPESFARLLDGTLLEGWDVELREHDRGRLMLTLRAPVGAFLSGKGDLLRLEARLYLSRVRGTELPFRLRSSSHCITFIEEAGYAELDSICGLNFRLIEANVEKYVPPTTYPNPARDLLTFEFGLGLDGPARLEVFDVQGHRAAVLLDEPLQPGGYSLDWDVRDLPAGVYWYRLTSGSWSGEGRFVIRQ